jgi:phosphoribosylamine---glycine ligase
MLLFASVMPMPYRRSGLSAKGLFMNVLLIGSGGREHALAWKLAQSASLAKLFAAPGNPGISEHATCVALNLGDHDAVVAFCRAETIALVVVGPEQPLVDGLADSLRFAGIACFGPSKAAAQLEGSKGFTKDFCARHSIPTAAYARFTARDAARAYVEAQGAPIVIKADGLAAGKGVVVAMTLTEALAAVDDIFAKPAGASVVVEAFMQGEEASFFVLTDGIHALMFGSAQDHKRVGEGDTGPNTGGMGAYAPAPIMTEAMTTRVMDEIIWPTIHGMAAEGQPYVGVLFAGLMLTDTGPQLIEYNCRFGDPECQVLMLRLASDLLPILHACATGRLNDVTAQWHDHHALTVVMAAKGYPAAPITGSAIKGVEAATALPDVKIFHAGTMMDGATLRASGGRVLNVSATGASVREAQAQAYAAVDVIDWPEGFCRRDIGWRAVS